MAVVGDLDSVKTKVQERLIIEDESTLRLDDPEVEDAIREGLDQFNIVSPLQKVHEQAGDGIVRRIVLNSTITGWVKSVSMVEAVGRVNLAGTDDEAARYFRKEDWEQSIDTNDDDVLLFSLATPEDETLRIKWLTACTVNLLDGATATTVPERYTEAFYLYLVATAAMYVATKAARLKQASFGADQTSFQEVYERWTDIARRKKRQAEERLGSIRGSVTGVGVSVNWATKTRFGWGTRISHG